MLIVLNKAGDLAGCEAAAIDALLALPQSPFHIAAKLDITNDPSDMAAHFDRFLEKESARFDVKAVYTEMNGFAINADRWFCDFFAYDNDGGLDDFDWLAEMESELSDDYTITGLEPLQKVYASAAFYDKRYYDAIDLAGLVVVAKFQRFMERTARSMKMLHVPLYVSAHDYDYIARIVPG